MWFVIPTEDFLFTMEVRHASKVTLSLQDSQTTAGANAESVDSLSESTELYQLFLQIGSF